MQQIVVAATEVNFDKNRDDDNIFFSLRCKQWSSCYNIPY